jgi:hypothetical protein
VIVVLVIVVSVVGIVFGGIYGGVKSVHPVVSRGGDVANLVVGVPILFGAIWLSRRGNLTGLILWPGALFFVVDTYSLYAVGAPFNSLFLAYVTLVILSAYTLVGVVASIDGDAVREWFACARERIVGGALIGIGAAAIAGLSSVVFSTLAGSAAGEMTLRSQGTTAVDYMVGSAPLLIGGGLLWRREGLGYVAAPGLLLVSLAGGVGFAISVVMEAIMSGGSIDWAVVAIHLIIATISLGLLGYFLRFTAKRQLRSMPRVDTTPINAGWHG